MFPRGKSSTLTQCPVKGTQTGAECNSQNSCDGDVYECSNTKVFWSSLEEGQHFNVEWCVLIGLMIDSPQVNF